MNEDHEIAGYFNRGYRAKQIAEALRLPYLIVIKSLKRQGL